MVAKAVVKTVAKEVVKNVAIATGAAVFVRITKLDDKVVAGVKALHAFGETFTNTFVDQMVMYEDQKMMDEMEDEFYDLDDDEDFDTFIED